jgi:hypothetical protein
MQIRFWGTRGSLPAPLTTTAIREKLATALTAAQGMKLETPAAIDEFIAQLPFSVSSTFGGDSSCVEIIDGEDNHVICDLGSGARRYGGEMLRRYGGRKNHRPTMCSCPICTGITSWDSRFSRPPSSPATAF